MFFIDDLIVLHSTYKSVQCLVVSEKFISNLKQLQLTGSGIALAILKFKELFCYCINQIDSILPWVSLIIDHRRRQNTVITSVAHEAIATCAFLRLFLRMQNGSYGMSGELKPSFLHAFSRSDVN